MDRSIYQNQDFVREFIATYKENPQLWDVNDPGYRIKSKRQESYEILVKISKKYYPEADEDFVRLRIESFRASFRKEQKKVVTSSIIPENSGIYKPNLWYYDLLLFLSGDTTEQQNLRENEVINNATNQIIWNVEQTAALINIYRKKTCLYSNSDPHYSKKYWRHIAIKQISDDLYEKFGKRINGIDIRRKITLLRTQFVSEYRKLQQRSKVDVEFKPSWMFYDMLSFLADEVKKKPHEDEQNWQHMSRKRSRSISEDDDDDDVVELKDGFYNSEEFDVIAQNIEYKLCRMCPKQRDLAEKLIREILFHGQMENLTAETKFIM